MKRKYYWCGFESGVPHIEPEPNSVRDGYGTLYRTRKTAREYYRDVRKVEIREVKKAREGP